MATSGSLGAESVAADAARLGRSTVATSGSLGAESVAADAARLGGSKAVTSGAVGPLASGVVAGLVTTTVASGSGNLVPAVAPVSGLVPGFAASNQVDPGSVGPALPDAPVTGISVPIRVASEPVPAGGAPAPAPAGGASVPSPAAVSGGSGEPARGSSPCIGDEPDEPSVILLLPPLPSRGMLTAETSPLAHPRSRTGISRQAPVPLGKTAGPPVRDAGSFPGRRCPSRPAHPTGLTGLPDWPAGPSERPAHPGGRSIRAAGPSGRPVHPGGRSIRAAGPSGRPVHPGGRSIRAAGPSGRPAHPGGRSI